MARVIPKRVLEDIRLQNDIVQVIGSYFTLQRSGSNFKALCPFHKEKTPSFHVNPQRQIFHCFGCGAGGDVFKFIQQHESVDFMTAVRMLAQRSGIRLELDEGGDEGGADKILLYRIHSEVAALYHRALRERRSAAAARAYLEKRDIPPDIVEEFQIGYAPDRWDAVLQWARRSKHPLEQVELGGLILRKSEGPGGSYYDRFRNRLMFPIADEQGRVIGFSGRALDADPKSAKYVNSPETPLFRKSRVLYALDKARKHIVEAREAIICEGQIDVIRCHQAGFRTAVAAQGTAFTEDHVRILKRYADSVCLLFDSDKAGQDAAIRAAAVFLGAGLAVRAGTLPPREDPDSFIRKRGAEGFRRLIDKAASAVSFQIAVLSGREDARSEVGVMRIARAVLSTVSHSPNAVQRAKLVQEAAERLGVPPTALQEELRHALRQSRPAEAREAEGERSRPTHPVDEVALCELAVHAADTPELGDLARRYLPPDLVSDATCRAIIEASLAAFESGRDLGDVLREREDPDGEVQRLAAQVQEAPVRVVGREATSADAARDIILRLWSRKFERERAELERRAGKGVDPEQELRRRQLTSHLYHLKKWEDGAPIIEIEMQG